MPPVADDPTAPAPKKKKPYFPAPPKPKPLPPVPKSSVTQHTSNTVAPAGKGNRAYAGRNPNVPPAYTPPAPKPTGPPAGGSYSRAQKLATTAQNLLNQGEYGYVSNYWISDIVQHRNEVMVDRRAQARTNMQQALDAYEAQGRAAIQNGSTFREYREENPFNKAEARNMEKGPIDYSTINEQLKQFVEKLKAAGTGGMQDYNTVTSLSYNFDKNLEAALKKDNDKREERNKVKSTMSGLKSYSDTTKKNALLETEQELQEYATDNGKNTSFLQLISGLTKNIQEDHARGAMAEQSGLELSRAATEEKRNPGGSIIDRLVSNMDGGLPAPEAPAEDLPEGFSASAKLSDSEMEQVETDTVGASLLQFKDNTTGNFLNESVKESWDSIDEPAMFALDMLSRPLNAVAEATDKTYDIDKDKQEDVPRWLAFTGGLIPGLVGKSLGGSVDEMVEDPSKVWDVVKAAGEGLTNEYDGGFEKVIANQAERDTRKTYHDNDSYQRFAGLAGDVLVDPANFIGVGLVTKPGGLVKSRLADDAVKNPGIARMQNQDPELQKFAADTWQSYRRIPVGQRLPDSPKSVNDIYDIFAGTYRGKNPDFTSQAGKVEAIKNARVDVDALRWELENFGLPFNSEIKNLEELRDRVMKVREGYGMEAEALTAFESIQMHLRSELNAGRMSPEDMADISDHIDTLSVESIVKEANQYNQYAYNVAERAGGLKPLGNNRTRPDLAFLEQRYEGYRKAAESDPDQYGPLVERERRKITEAQDYAIGNKPVPRDAYDMLGPRWAMDPRFSREETNKLFEDTYKYVSDKDTHFKKINESIKVTQNAIKDLRIKQKNGALPANSAQNSIDLAFKRLGYLYDERNHIQAAAFIKAANAKVAQGTDDLAQYSDPAAAGSLRALRDMATARLNEPSVSYTGVDDTDNIRSADYLANEKKYEERRAELETVTDPAERETLLKILDRDRNSIFNNNSLREPSPKVTGKNGVNKNLPPELLPQEGFFDSHQQAQSVLNDTNAQLKELQVFNDKGYINKLEEFDAQSVNLAQRVPQTLLAEDGTLDVERALGTIAINPATMTVHIATKDPQERIWAAELKDIVSERMKTKYLAEQEKITKPRREAHRESLGLNRTPTQVDINNLTPEQQDVLTMFGADGDYGIKKINSGKTLPPVVTAPNGERMAIGSTKFKSTFREQITPKDIKQAEKYSKLLDDVTEWNKTAAKGVDAKLNNSALTAVRKYLQEAGVTNLPKTNQALARHLHDNRNAFREHHFTPEMVLGNRLFKEEHGISVLDARIMQDHAFPKPGRVIQDHRKGGARFNKDGLITIDEFILAHNDFDEFKKLTERGPFKMSYNGGKSEKAWRDSGGRKGDWYDENFKAINDPKKMTSAKRKSLITAAFNRTVNAKGFGEIEKTKFTEEAYQQQIRGNQWLKADEKKAIAHQAISDTREYTKAALEQGDLQSKGLTRQKLPLMDPVDRMTPINDIHKALMYRLRGQETYVRDMLTKYNKADKEHQLWVNRLDEINKQIKAEKAAHAARRAEGKKVTAEAAKRLDEQMLLHMAEQAVVKPGRRLSVVTSAGTMPLMNFDRLAERVGSAADHNFITKSFKDAYNHYLRPPSSQFDEFADAYRERTTQSARRIQVNLEELTGSVGKYPKRVRESFFESVRKGNAAAFTGTNEQRQALEQAFAPIMQSLKESEDLGGVFVHPSDVNEFVNKKFQLHPDDVGRIETIEDVLLSMERQARVNFLRNKDKPRKGLRKPPQELDLSHLKDPYYVAWQLRLGVEQARAKSAFIKSIGDVFGLSDIARGSTKPFDQPDFNKAMNKLQQKGWRKVEMLGTHHIFPPESADIIQKMVDMLEPRNIREFSKLADSAIGAWKAATTVYNPAYWTKNGIGEVYISYLAGVNDPRAYHTAAKLVKYAKGDGAKLESLKGMHPLLAHMKSDVPDGSAIAYTRRNGEKVSYADLWTGYNEAGLKTGFFDNDLARRHSKLGSWAREKPIANIFPQAHEKFRAAGEGYEDFLRMAHFVDAVKKSGKPLEQAIKDAGDEVRKFHFDYDDFTQFEKTVMLRVFPFYKWTRKAAPLMLQTLFLNPGRVVNPLKVQNAISNEITSTDIADDPNGFAPNLEGIAPQFVKDMWLYEITEPTGEDGAGATVSKLPLPTIDTYKNLEDPRGMAYGLLNPYAKTPIEMLKESREDNPQMLNTLLNNLSPQTKFAEKKMDEEGLTGQDWTNFGGIPTFKLFDFANQDFDPDQFSGGKY